ncbi:MAG: transposase, partial [Terriglobales bacterium]
SARRANCLLGRSGPFWQHESYDHVVRDAAEGVRIRRYIEANPLRAGLAAQPEDFPWSSASTPITPMKMAPAAVRAAIVE